MNVRLEIPTTVRRGRRMVAAGVTPDRNRVPPDRVQLLVSGAGLLTEVLDLTLDDAAELARRLPDLVQDGEVTP